MESGRSENKKRNHRSDLENGDSESQPGMGKFVQVVQKALNKQPSTRADLLKAMETLVTREPPISEGEKLPFTGIKGNDGKESQSFTSTSLPQSLAVQLEEVERLKVSLARKLAIDWNHRRGILSRKRLNFDEFEKAEKRKNLKRLKLTSQDVEIIDLEGDSIDDEMVNEEASTNETDVTITEEDQTSNDDPEILEIRPKKVKISTNGDEKDDFALTQSNSSKSPQLSDIITLDEDEAAEHDESEEAHENNLSSGEKVHEEMLEDEIIELEEISLASPVPKNSDNCSSTFFASENNDLKAAFKRSFAVTQMNCDDEPSTKTLKMSKSTTKTLKMSKSTTLDENEDVIELD